MASPTRYLFAPRSWWRDVKPVPRAEQVPRPKPVAVLCRECNAPVGEASVYIHGAMASAQEHFDATGHHPA